MRWPLGCWLLTEPYVFHWTWWRILDSESCGLQQRSWCTLLQCCTSFRRCMVTDIMDTSGYNFPIRAYIDNSHKMRVSHDEDSSDPKDLCSLGVADLDLSLSPDAFDLRAFHSKKPLTRMLPGWNPCELRLMLPQCCRRITENLTMSNNTLL